MSSAQERKRAKTDLIDALLPLATTAYATHQLLTIMNMYRFELSRVESSIIMYNAFVEWRRFEDLFNIHVCPDICWHCACLLACENKWIFVHDDDSSVVSRVSFPPAVHSFPIEIYNFGKYLYGRCYFGESSSFFSFRRKERLSNDIHRITSHEENGHNFSFYGFQFRFSLLFFRSGCFPYTHTHTLGASLIEKKRRNAFYIAKINVIFMFIAGLIDRFLLLIRKHSPYVAYICLMGEHWQTHYE